MIKILSPAKLNIFLEVLQKRADGYHDIDSVFVKVNLCDSIDMELINDEVIMVSTDHPSVPDGPDNIVYKSVIALKKYFNRNEGVRISIKKVIPVGGGMGGGSSNAAAVIKGLCKLWGYDYSSPDVMGIAARIGADVPFFLSGHTIAVCKGIGEIITPVASDLSLTFVVVNPNVMISTGDIYRKVNLTSARKDSIIITEAISRKCLDKIGVNFFNRMEDTVIKDFPVIAEIKKALLEAGCSASLMSGSGSTVFGLVKNDHSRDNVIKHIREKYPEWFSCIVATIYEK
jgi:4-diphosphocytidyl-2-C-methyl-D-erythritol kinase